MRVLWTFRRLIPILVLASHVWAGSVSVSTACVNGLQIDINGGAAPGASVTSIGWNWGDGVSTTGFFPSSHTYSSPGSYTVQTTAHFNDGTSASASQTVSVATGVLTNCVALTITAGTGGTVFYQASVGSGSVAAGSSFTLQLDLANGATLIAIPAPGYTFASWSASPGISGVTTTAATTNTIVNSASTIAASFTASSVSQAIINTIAGTDPVYKGLPTNPLTAPLCGVQSVATTTNNLFFVDACLNLLVAVNNTTGLLSIVAGNGIAGYSGDGGPSANAQLNQPTLVRITPSHGVYIFDSGNHRIRQVANNVITTYAGNGTAGFSGDGGPATQAQIGNVTAMTTDSLNNLYIADSGTVRKIGNGPTPYTIITIAGPGPVGGNCAPTFQGTATSVSGTMPAICFAALNNSNATGSVPLSLSGTSSGGQTVFSGAVSGSGTTTCSNGSTGNWSATFTLTITVSPAVPSLAASGGTVSGSWTLGGASGPTSITVCGSTTQGNIVITTGSSNVAGSVSAGGSVSLTLGSGNQSAGPTALPSNNNIQGLAYDANTGYIYAS